MKSYSIGVIGCGYWGPNLIRNFIEHSQIQHIQVCDKNPTRLAFIKKRYPTVEVTDSPEQIFQNPKVDAVAIATPVSTHYPFAQRALNQGKHVWIEKPMTTHSQEALELAHLAQEKGRVLLVDHTFLYTGAVNKIRECIEAGMIGDCLYFDSVRINLGLFQHDVNVLWDLAVHDISIMLYLLGNLPVWVQATGVRHFEDQHENIAYLMCEMPNNMSGHIHVNWVSPVKIRRIILGGSQKMIVYDDNEVFEKVKIYDSGIDFKAHPEQLHELLISYRTGDIQVPKLDNTEALKKIVAEFIHCIEKGKQPLSNGEMGYNVVRVMEAASKSISESGKRIQL